LLGFGDRPVRMGARKETKRGVLQDFRFSVNTWLACVKKAQQFKTSL
jgi:hypothetical protein